MRAGFTLLEVIVSLLLLEIAVVAAAGTLVVASRTLAEAEHLELAVTEAEGLLDSLAATSPATSGSRVYAGGVVEWTIDGTGALSLRVASSEGDTRLEVASWLVAP